MFGQKGSPKGVTIEHGKKVATWRNDVWLEKDPVQTFLILTTFLSTSQRCIEREYGAILVQFGNVPSSPHLPCPS